MPAMPPTADERLDATRTNAAGTRGISPGHCTHGLANLVAFRHDPRLLIRQPFPQSTEGGEDFPADELALDPWT